jgi:DNA-directed RNA polymerase specialized sigma24 family protein
MSGRRSVEDDAALVRRIAEDRDQFALEALLERHALKATGHLRRQFEHQLQHLDIDEAVNRAAMNVWENAENFDYSQPFGPWFLQISHNAGLDILRGQQRELSGELGETDLPDPFDDEELDLSPTTLWWIEQLEQIIYHELRGFEQIVAFADLAAGGPADTDFLMQRHKKSRNMVQVTRSKVWKKIRTIILERAALRGQPKVNR